MREHKSHNPFESIEHRLDRIEDAVKRLIVLQENQKITDKQDNGIALAVRVTGYTKKTLYNLVYKRLIPHSKKGGKLFFDEAELKNWIQDGKRLTREELGI